VYLCVLGFSVVIGAITVASAPAPLALPLTMLTLTAVVVTARPVVGIYLIGFLTLFTDGTVSPWYPFLKNMSSRESILYLNNAMFTSPFEVVLGITAVAWLLRLLIDRGGGTFVRGRLLWPMVAFGGFVLLGVVVGVGTGGDRYVALWEFRPLLYVPILYVLVTNLFTSREQYRRLGALMLVALVIHAFLAMIVYAVLSAAERKELESLVGHASAVQMGVVLFAAIAVWLLPKTPWSWRVLVPLAALPVGWAFLVSQRRAAIVALAAAILLLGILLTRLNPRLLRKVAPVVIVLTIGYIGAFWNSESLAGFPAQAIKTVISPSEVGDKDLSSDGYRTVENLDIHATIHAKPLTGLGFGQKFYRPFALPDISFFPFYEYMPHNSLLWFWIKTGAVGFLALLFLFGSSIRSGVRTALELAPGRDVVLATSCLSYVVMYLIYAYVDVAWDTRSMICLALVMAVCADYLRLPDRVGGSLRARPVAPAVIGPRPGLAAVSTS
jgi:O-antigen ligase